MNVYWTCFGDNAATSFVTICCKKAVLFRPFTTISPICETSNSPAFVRVTSCSCLIPAYCTGKSQPPKSIVLAPHFTYSEKIGVFLSLLIQSSPLFYVYFRSTHPLLLDIHKRTEISLCMGNLCPLT